MSCWDSHVIYSSDINDDDIYGHIDNEYPGCGSCSFCCYQNSYDSEKIAKDQNLFQEWIKKNNKRYRCDWTTDKGRGSFSFRASSLSNANEVARKSIDDWTTLYVVPELSNVYYG